MPVHCYDFSQLDKSRGPADFVVRCREAGSKDMFVYKIQKAVVRGQSSYLDMVMDGNFIEAQKNYLNKQDNPAIIAAILCCLHAKDGPFSFPGNVFDVILTFIPKIMYLFDGPLWNIIEFIEALDEWHLSQLYTVAEYSIQITFELPAKDDPKYGGWVQQLERVLVYVFEDVPRMTKDGLHHLRQLLAFLCHTRLDQNIIEDLLPKISSLSLYIYKEIKAEVSRLTTCWTCSNCYNVRRGSNEKKAFVKEKNGALIRVTCHCGFRGLCTHQCKATEDLLRELDSATRPIIGLCCENCIEAGAIGVESRMYRCDAGLESGETFFAYLYHDFDGVGHLSENEYRFYPSDEEY